MRVACRRYLVLSSFLCVLMKMLGVCVCVCVCLCVCSQSSKVGVQQGHQVLCVCMSACVCVCMCACFSMYTCMREWVRVHVCMCVRVCVYAWVSECVYVCVMYPYTLWRLEVIRSYVQYSHWEYVPLRFSFRLSSCWKQTTNCRSDVGLYKWHPKHRTFFSLNASNQCRNWPLSLLLMFPKWVVTARKRSLRRLCFYRCLSVHGGRAWLLQWGGMHGCSGGCAWLPPGGWVCVVAPRGACMVAPRGGMRGCSRGACVVAPGGGVHGCSRGSVHGSSQGGHVWLLPGGGMHGFFHEIRSMSGRYASYWNAFLLCI